MPMQDRPGNNTYFMTAWGASDVATLAFGACSFAPAYGEGSALAGKDAGIGRDATFTQSGKDGLFYPYSNARGPWPPYSSKGNGDAHFALRQLGLPYHSIGPYYSP